MNVLTIFSLVNLKKSSDINSNLVTTTKPKKVKQSMIKEKRKEEIAHRCTQLLCNLKVEIAGVNLD